MTLEREREEDIDELLTDIRGLVASHLAGSLTWYPGREKLDSFFALQRQDSESISATTSLLVKEHIPEKKLPESNKKSDHKILAEIGAEAEKCRRCVLGESRSKVVAGKNGGRDIRLFIVGHWLDISEDMSGQPVFGLEEDRMLTRMLTAINLPLEEVFISNVIKCSVGKGIQPQAGNIKSCISYLQHQIRAASPDCICTMGMVATRAVLNLSQPLSRLRGRFHPYRLADGVEIPLLPTYHPGYLLQNPEMKRATWQDLQNLGRKLGTEIK